MKVRELWSSLIGCCDGTVSKGCGENHSKHLLQYVRYILLMYLFQLSSTASAKRKKKHLSWCMIYFLIPSPLIHVWCLTRSLCLLDVTLTSAASLNAEIIAALGYHSFCISWFMSVNLTDFLVESVPSALLLLLRAKLHSGPGWTPNNLGCVIALSVTGLKHPQTFWDNIKTQCWLHRHWGWQELAVLSQCHSFLLF